VTPTRRYRTFGLSIRSALALPAPLEADPDGTTVDLHVGIGPLLAPPEADSGIARISNALCLDPRAPAHWVLHAFGRDLRQRFSFDVRPGSIVAGWNAGVEPADLARHLVGVALAAHTFVSGRVCLHGSAVRAGGSTLVLLGDSGFGKSTLTAALVAQGSQLVCEEIILLGADPLLVSTGLPTIKLAPEGAAATGFSDPLRRAFVHTDYASEGVLVELETKHLAPLSQSPMAQILLLGARHTATGLCLSDALAPAAAAEALARAAYWMAYLPMTTRHRVMRAAFDIALRCPVRRLSLPDDLGSLPTNARGLINVMIEAENA